MEVLSKKGLLYTQKSKHWIGYLFLLDITYKLNLIEPSHKHVKVICNKRFYRFNIKIAFHAIRCQLLDMLEQSNIDISTWYNAMLFFFECRITSDGSLFENISTDLNTEWKKKIPNMT